MFVEFPSAAVSSVKPNSVKNKKHPVDEMTNEDVQTVLSKAVLTS